MSQLMRPYTWLTQRAQVASWRRGVVRLDTTPQTPLEGQMAEVTRTNKLILEHLMRRDG